MKRRAFDFQHLADGEADAVWAVLAALSEDAGERPGLVAAWMARAERRCGGFGVVEPVEDFNMGECVEA